MKIYISGPITGYPELNQGSFKAAEARLRDLGHEPLNPFDCGLGLNETWDAYLRADLRMVTHAEGVALLPGWEASRGARLEVHVAHALGMTTLPIDQWRPA